MLSYKKINEKILLTEPIDVIKKTIGDEDVEMSIYIIREFTNENPYFIISVDDKTLAINLNENTYKRRDGKDEEYVCLTKNECKVLNDYLKRKDVRVSENKKISNYKYLALTWNKYNHQMVDSRNKIDYSEVK